MIMEIEIILVCENCNREMKSEKYIGHPNIKVTPCPCLVNEAVEMALTRDAEIRERGKKIVEAGLSLTDVYGCGCSHDKIK